MSRVHRSFVACMIGALIIVLGALQACAPRAAEPALADPIRVVSLNPCVDAILMHVADPEQILSISHYSRDPATSSVPVAWARRFKFTTGTAEEAILLRPNLIIAGPHVARSTLFAFARLHLRVLEIGVPDRIAQSAAQIRAIAKAVNHIERGEALIAQIEARLRIAAERERARPIRALIWHAGGLTPGAGTLADELLTRTGFRNQSREYGLAAWDVLPVERLLAQPPELLLSSRDAALAGDRITGHPALRHVRAHRSGQAGTGLTIVDFPPRFLNCAGPTLLESLDFLNDLRAKTGDAS